MDLLTVAARIFLDTADYESGLDAASRAAQEFSSALTGRVEAAASQVSSTLGALGWASPGWGSDMMAGFIDGINAMWESLRSTVSAVARTVRNYLGFSEPEEGPLSDFHTYAPDMMALFAGGIRENAHLVTEAIGASFDLQPAISEAAAPAGPRQEIVVPRQSPGGTASAVMEVDGTVFAHLVYRLYNEEAARVGVSLAGVRP